MPLTRTEGDFSQVSNIVFVTTPEPPPPLAGRIFIGFLDGQTWVIEADFVSGYQSGTVDLGLGYSLGYSQNADSTIMGSYGQALEGSSAGAARSIDFSKMWPFEGAPIYTNASARSTRVAFGNGVWIMVGTRTTGVGSGASSADFGNDAFTWDSITANLVDAVGTIGFAGIDFVLGRFYAYTNDGQIIRSTDGNEWEVVASGGPAFTFNSSNANPYARFAALGTTIVCIAGGRIVASIDSGNTWEMSAYVDAFSSTDLIGGAGFNNPVEFGLAAGGGAFIAVGTVPSDLTDGVVTFIAAQIDGAGGSFPTGLLRFACENFIGAPTSGQPSGTYISGTLMGYSSVSIATFGGSGTEMSIAIEVPTAEAPASPRTAFFIDFDIPGITPGPILQTASFAFVTQESGPNTQYIWRFGFVGLTPMNEEQYTVTFTPAGPVVLDPVPRIRRSTIGAEAVWTDITVPAGPDQLFDAIYDTEGSRFLLLGKDTVFTPGASGGEFLFDPGDAQGSGWAGSSAEGVSNLFSTWDFVTASQAEPCGNLQFGDIAGYFDIALIHTGELGGQTMLMIHVPEAELREIPQSDYFDEMVILFSEGQIGPLSQEDATFEINFDADQGVWELAWMWIDPGTFSENDLEVGLSPSVTYTGGTSVYNFHVLQSLDAGVTFTDEFVQEYTPSGGVDDKGWIFISQIPPETFYLLQEDSFRILQEDDFGLLVEYAIDAILGGQIYPIIDWSFSYNGALPPGVQITGYELYRMDAETFQDLQNFDPPITNPAGGIGGPLVPADLVLLVSLDSSQTTYQDTGADPTLRQYAYYLKILTSDAQYDSSSAITYSPSI
jgi:hypothetical protein